MYESEKQSILKDILGYSHREGSEQFLFKCPKCNHHKNKLSVNFKENAFKCWICDYSGRNILKLIRVYGSHAQYKDWKKLQNKVDITTFEDKLLPFKNNFVEEKKNIYLPKEFISLVNKNLPYSALHARNYLKDRGITKEDIVYWKIGYCTEGEFANRVIIPSFNLEGKCNYFIARAYDNQWRKYLNPKANRNIIFNHLYLDFKQDIVIVEGAFDAIKAGRNSIPLLGSTLRDDSHLFYEIIKNNSTVYLALDPDAKKKTTTLAKKLLKYDIKTYLVDVGPYADVGEMSKDEFEKRKQNAVLVSKDFYLLLELNKL